MVFFVIHNSKFILDQNPANSKKSSLIQPDKGKKIPAKLAGEPKKQGQTR
jgi:hypothetical protein